MANRNPDDYSVELRICAAKNYEIPSEFTDEDLELIDQHRVKVINTWIGLKYIDQQMADRMLATWRERVSLSSTDIFNKFLIGGSYADT